VIAVEYSLQIFFTNETAVMSGEQAGKQFILGSTQAF
jgi:hypothetical protein